MRSDPWPWHVPADLVECDSEGHILPDWPLRQWGATGTLGCLQPPCCLQLPSCRRRSEIALLPRAANITHQTHPQVSCSGKIQLLEHQQNHSIRTDGQRTASIFCLLSWDGTSRPWIFPGGWGSVLLSHSPSLQSSTLSSAVCSGTTQVCCPNKAPVKCKHCHRWIPPQNCYRESYVQKKKKIQQYFWNTFETLLKLCISLLLKQSPVFNYVHTLILCLEQDITHRIKCWKAAPLFSMLNSNLFYSVSNSILFCAWHSKHY